eukprot:PITA_16460
MYLVNNRSDICYAIINLSQFMLEPKRAHWAATKHVLSGSGITSWCSRKQKSVDLSSFEAEYMAASIVSCEAIWLRKLRVNLFRRNMQAIRIMCDNQSCIKLYENPIFHDRSKHIDIRCHFARDCVQRGAVQLSYTPTREQVADILTKALGK